LKHIYSTMPGNKFARYLLPALVLGASWAIFLHGYWLIDLFPIDSRRLLLATLLMGLLGTAGYIVLFHFTGKLSSGISKTQLAGLIGASVLAGVFLFFAATDRWQAPTRYFTLLLPRQTVQISIPAGHEAGDISIAWINTSLGDISYDTVEYKGWKRESDKLILTDPANNNLLWSGKTGGNAQIIFEVPARSGNVIVSWNGQEEVLRFSAQKTTTVHSFDIPFYASRDLVLLLGVLNFIILCFPVCLLVWKKRVDMFQPLRQSLTGTPKRFEAWEWAVIAGVIFLAALLRLPNLENLFPGVDEYYQLIAARQITQSIPMADVYSRSLWLVTLPASLMFRVFGYELWAARLPGAVMNVFAVIPLYFVARKINRPVAVLSILLYATSPWVITFGRIVREYAYYPFIYYLVIYGMILFLERFPDRFRIDRDWKSLFSSSSIFLLFCFMLPPVYALFVDLSSTLKLFMVAYVIFGVFVFLKMDLKDKKNLFLISILAIMILAGTYYWFNRYSVRLGFNFAPFSYFFLNPPQQWYFERLKVIPLVGFLGVILVSFLVRRTNLIPLFLLTLFASFFSFFAFSSKEFFGTRHLSTTNLWYIILTAMGLYLFWLFLRTFTVFQKKWFMYLTVAVLGFMVFNVQQSILPITDDDPYMSISKDYHHDMGTVNEFMLANVQDGDVLIASVYGLYAEWKGAPKFRDIFRFTTQTPDEDFLSLIDQNNSGWIVIDTIRVEDAAFPVFDALAKDSRVEYVGLFGDEHVWRWQKQARSPQP